MITEYFGAYEPTESIPGPWTGDFISMSKIPRLSRDCVISEKIDGTNAQVYIEENGAIHAGSRNRWLDSIHDNFGFALWVFRHTDELIALGPGRHYGEWYGLGIQRGYSLFERRFALFRVPKGREIPTCCCVVPTLYNGPFDTTAIANILTDLQTHGSYAAPGYMNPEGIVIYHKAAGISFKKTINDDDKPKGVANE